MASRPDNGKADKTGTIDPGLFPHRLSFDEELVSFVPTNATKLRAASFLDDRCDFATRPAQLIAMGDALSAGGRPAEPNRFIFHVSFSGSTLLSRLLDHTGRSLVLREPQSLSDLAARRARIDQTGGSDPRVDRMLVALPALLARRWEPNEAVVIKPSNWVNNLAPAFCSGGQPTLPLFLSMQPRTFLLAVFRGGHERIAFTARAALHFSQAGRLNADRVALALAHTDDQTAQLARLAALAHRMQSELFATARSTGGWSEEHCIDFAELMADPVTVAAKAAKLLDLDLPAAIIEANAEQWLGRDAKQPANSYAADARNLEDREVEERFGKTIDDALSWMDRL
ncbi:MAG: hypothetical protein ABWZ75_06275 [Novosphingobium sp.]